MSAPSLASCGRPASSPTTSSLSSSRLQARAMSKTKEPLHSLILSRDDMANRLRGGAHGTGRGARSPYGSHPTLAEPSALHCGPTQTRGPPGGVRHHLALPLPLPNPKTRTERDVQIVNVVLHVVLNLAFIKDLPANVYLSADQAEFASPQRKLIRTFRIPLS